MHFMPPRLVILDTNFLLVPFQFKIDVFSEIDYLLEVSYQLVVSSASVSELKRIAKKVGRNGMAARLAVKTLDANSKKIEIIQSDEYVDDWILDYALRTGAIVCTNDGKLRKRLIEGDVKVITLKGKSRIGFA